jgi:hypothetical protein
MYREILWLLIMMQLGIKNKKLCTDQLGSLSCSMESEIPVLVFFAAEITPII